MTSARPRTDCGSAALERLRRAINPGLAALALLASLAAHAQTEEPIHEAWRRPLGSVQSLAVSPNGKYSAVVTWAGEVLCWAEGRRCWQRSVPGAEAVALVSGGRAVVYTPLDARRRDLLFLDTKGRVTGRGTAGAPILQLALSPSGGSIAVGTAEKAVEIYPWDGGSRPTRLDLPGVCQQLGYDRHDNLLVATREPAWLLMFDRKAQPVWQKPAPGGREFRIATPPRTAGKHGQAPLTVVAVVPSETPDPPPASRPRATQNTSRTRPSVSAPRIQLIAYSDKGDSVWQRVLVGRNPHLRLMDQVGEVVVAYERADRRGAAMRYNHVLACFDHLGDMRSPTQGGMVYSPLLVCASPDGSAVLTLAAGNRFWLLSSRGQALWSYTAPAPVRLVRASRDGRTVAVATSDGQLAVLKIGSSSDTAADREAKIANQPETEGR